MGVRERQKNFEPCKDAYKKNYTRVESVRCKGCSMNYIWSLSDFVWVHPVVFESGKMSIRREDESEFA